MRWRAGLFASIESDERSESVNWKSIFTYVIAAGLGASITPWAQSTISGQHVPFTVGTIAAPFAIKAVLSLAALFTQKPNATPGS